MKPRRVCGWHEKYFGEPLILEEGDASKESHGICERCFAVFQSEVEEDKRRQAA